MKKLLFFLVLSLQAQTNQAVTVNNTRVQGGVSGDYLKVNSNGTLGQGTVSGGGSPAGSAGCVQLYGTSTTFACANGVNVAKIGNFDPGFALAERIGFASTASGNVTAVFQYMTITPTVDATTNQENINFQLDLNGTHNFMEDIDVMGDLEVNTTGNVQQAYGVQGDIFGNSAATYTVGSAGVNGYVHLNAGTVPINNRVAGVEGNIELNGATVNGGAVDFVATDPLVEGMTTLGGSAILAGFYSEVTNTTQQWAYYGFGNGPMHSNGPFDITVTGPPTKIGFQPQITGNGSDAYTEAAEFDVFAGKNGQQLIAGYFLAGTGGFTGTELDAVYVGAPSYFGQEATVFGVNIEDLTRNATLPVVAINIQDQTSSGVLNKRGILGGLGGWENADYYLSDGVAFINLPTPTAGMSEYCSDCQPTTIVAGVVTNAVCKASGTGANAIYLNGAWTCQQYH